GRTGVAWGFPVRLLDNPDAEGTGSRDLVAWAVRQIDKSDPRV
ncbi:MAG: hypothetical protein AVDCRST_MAG87-1803, partial [uncultured Thermomicrobiales bacterium]